MASRQSRLAVLRTIGCLAAVLLAVLAVITSGRAQEPRGDRPARSAAKTRPFAPDRLLRAFRGKREDVRHRMLDEIERWHRGDEGVAPALWQAIEAAGSGKPVPDSVLRAIQLYSQLADADTDAHMISLLSAADLRVVLAAVDILAARRPAAALDPLMKLREHPDYPASYGLRHAVISAVARYDDAASVEFLVAAVNALDGQLKYVTAGQLARLTGQNFGGQGEAWRRWWAANQAGFRVVAASAAADGPQAGALAGSAGGDMPWDDPVPSFFGTPVFAKRVIFVIDISKSMLSSVDGVTRLEDAQQQLEMAIRGLPDDAWFGIVAYNDTEHAYQRTLVQASPMEKSAAIRFMKLLTPAGKTNIYDTLADVLTVDPNLEAILLLSDGDPNVGTVVDRATIVARITQQNAASRISINTIGIDAQGVSQEFLKRLAADNFGDFREIR